MFHFVSFINGTSNNFPLFTNYESNYSFYRRICRVLNFEGFIQRQSAHQHVHHCNGVAVTRTSNPQLTVSQEGRSSNDNPAPTNMHPTSDPTEDTSEFPSTSPSKFPTKEPIGELNDNPTLLPSKSPSLIPTTHYPTELGIHDLLLSIHQYHQ